MSKPHPELVEGRGEHNPPRYATSRPWQTNDGGTKRCRRLALWATPAPRCHPRESGDPWPPPREPAIDGSRVKPGMTSLVVDALCLPLTSAPSVVIPGLDPGTQPIHVIRRLSCWAAGSSPAMTTVGGGASSTTPHDFNHRVIPAQAGIQTALSDVREPRLDSRLRGNDTGDGMGRPARHRARRRTLSRLPPP